MQSRVVWADDIPPSIAAEAALGEVLREQSRRFDLDGSRGLSVARLGHNEETLYGWLESAHLAIVVDDLDRAEQLLAQHPRPVRFNKRHLGVLNDLVQLARLKVPDDQRQPLADRVNEYYDWARNPLRPNLPGKHMPATLGPLEIGILRQKYIVGPANPIDWRQLIEDYVR